MGCYTVFRLCQTLGSEEKYTKMFSDLSISGGIQLQSVTLKLGIIALASAQWVYDHKVSREDTGDKL